MPGRLAAAMVLIVSVFLGTFAWAETRPQGRDASPPPKGTRSDGPGPDATKDRAPPPKGKGFHALPEKDDTVLLRGKGR